MPFTVREDGKLIPIRRGPEEVLELVRREKVEFVDLQFTDFPGRLQHVTIPAHELDEGAFQEGVPKLDGSSIRGFMEIHESDMVLRADPSTFGLIPWGPDHLRTARLLCDVNLGFGLGRFSRDPRWIAQNAEQAARSAGYDFSLWGPEIEFFVFSKVTWDVLTPYRGQSYSIDSIEAAWNPQGTNFPIRFKEGYYPAPPQDTLQDYRSDCVKVLTQQFGVPCDAHHHEVATAGQCEIDMIRDSLTNMADNVMTYKFVIRNLAAQRGLVASTMPKPIYGDNASGMHVHVSLWSAQGNPRPTPDRQAIVELLETDRARNLFYDANDSYAELSQLGRYFGGGLMEHSRSLAAIVAPTTNSYRRLVPGFEAPVFIAWSRRNRSANVRIPVYQTGATSAARKRVEFRTPDPSCNPYLAFAAILAAGLDGIRKKRDIGDPVDEDIYKLTPERRRQLGVRELPGDLQEALSELESDHNYLTPIFPADAIEKLIELGMQDHRQVAARPHPYEFHLYFDI
jgi:glutamine synthetase